MMAVIFIFMLLAPFLPFTSERLHSYLGYDSSLFGKQAVESRQDSLGTHNVLRYLPEGASGKWEPSRLRPGQALKQPFPLFRKLDESIVEEERSRLGK